MCIFSASAPPTYSMSVTSARMSRAYWLYETSARNHIFAAWPGLAPAAFAPRATACCHAAAYHRSAQKSCVLTGSSKIHRALVRPQPPSRLLYTLLFR